MNHDKELTVEMEDFMKKNTWQKILGWVKCHFFKKHFFVEDDISCHWYSCKYCHERWENPE